MTYIPPLFIWQLAKKKCSPLGGHFQRDEHFVFQKAHNSFCFVSISTNTQKKIKHVFSWSTSLPSALWEYVLESGRLLVVNDECQQNKDLDKDRIVHACCMVKETMYLLTFQRSLGWGLGCPSFGLKCLKHKRFTKSTCVLRLMTTTQCCVGIWFG
jgi:hypothetical protein